MNNNKKCIAVIVSCLFVVMTIMCFSACSSTSSIEKPNDVALDEVSPSDDAVLTIHGILEEKTEDQLFEQSSLLIIGTVKGNGNSFQVRKATGETGNFTDYEIDVANTLRGNLEQFSVVVRVRGGTAGGVTEICTPGPELKTGEEYLLFLYKPARGGDFNTEGNYYYVLGLTQGVFQKVSNNAEKLTTDVYKSQNGHEITYARIQERANEYPVNELYFRTEYIENQQRNLENGFITQAEYEQIMSNIDVYESVVLDE